MPVTDLDVASNWYCSHFGMTETKRQDKPVPCVILERDGVRLGFAITGGDPTQDGAAILVAGLAGLREELDARGVNVGNTRTDENDDGTRQTVFFVIAPDGLCYYFHEPVSV